MRAALVALVLAPVLSTPALAAAPTPIAAHVDKVTVEIGGDAATVVIIGRYVVVKAGKQVVEAGRLHYKCDAKLVAACIDSWTLLARAVGSHACVGWGQDGNAPPQTTLPYNPLGTPLPWPSAVPVAQLGKDRCADLDKSPAPH